MKKDKKKTKFVDPGHTIYDMSNVPTSRPSFKNDNGVSLTPKERRAAVMAAFAHFLPILFGVIACFLVAMLLILWWLN